MGLLFKFLKIVFILFIGTSFAQENEDNFYLYYFSGDAGSELDKVQNVKKEYFGRYELKENRGNEVRIAAGDNLIVDDTGIAIEKNRLLTISREEIRENSQYHISNGYLFGISGGDSVMITPDGNDNYLFLYPVKTYLYEVGKTNKIYQGANKQSYLILEQDDNGYWNSMYVQFSGVGIALKEISFESDCSIEDIKNKDEKNGEYKTYILNPSNNEWNALFNCFLMYDFYTKSSD